MLEDNTMIGRPAARGNLEVVMVRRSHGQVALYRYAVEVDIVFFLASCSHRIIGYAK